MTRQPKWAPISWRINSNDRTNAPHIDLCAQISGPDLYAVRRHGYCLNHLAEWEYEPQPSGRDDAFLARCRFATFDEAANAYAAHVAKRQGDQATRQPTAPTASQAQRDADERKAA